MKKRIIFIAKNLKLLINNKKNNLLIKKDDFSLVIVIPSNIFITKKKNLLILNLPENLMTWSVNFQNLFSGLARNFKIRLFIKGVGYKANLNGTKLDLKLGYSHPITYETKKTLISLNAYKNTMLTLAAPLKDILNNEAAQLRALKEPSAYKNKGITYKGEILKLKPGKKS